MNTYQTLICSVRVGTIHEFASCPRGRYISGGTKVKVIGRTAAASNAETSMGSHLIEVEASNGGRFFTEKHNLRD
jgi:hypothetical protein